jgi:ankyrin repeat protein
MDSWFENFPKKPTITLTTFYKRIVNQLFIQYYIIKNYKPSNNQIKSLYEVLGKIAFTAPILKNNDKNDNQYEISKNDILDIINDYKNINKFLEDVIFNSGIIIQKESNNKYKFSILNFFEYFLAYHISNTLPNDEFGYFILENEYNVKLQKVFILIGGILSRNKDNYKIDRFNMFLELFTFEINDILNHDRTVFIINVILEVQNNYTKDYDSNIDMRHVINKRMPNIFNIIKQDDVSVLQNLIKDGLNIEMKFGIIIKLPWCKKNHTYITTTMFGIAARYGSLEIMKFLMKNNANKYLKYVDPIKPIHLAVIYGHIREVKYLIYLDSSFLNLKSVNFRTPLHLAALFNHLNIVKFLVSEGCNIYQKDSYNKTALQISIENGYEDISNYLSKIK